MRQFPRRMYHHPAALVRDVREVVRHRDRLRTLRDGTVVDDAFRERIMLAVTAVNGCRYCSYAHARMALAAGLTQEEIGELAVGDLAGAPAEQVPALLYAQHWAESETRPDPAARERVVEIHGESATEVIEAAMRMIRIGNLLGNTWDFVLYTVSGGRWGAVEPQLAPSRQAHQPTASSR